MAAKCSACGRLTMPPRAICAHCRGAGPMSWAELSGRGKLVTFTAIAVGLSAMIAEGYTRANPYVTGIVELDEGVRITGRILGIDGKTASTADIGRIAVVEYLTADDGSVRPLVAFRVA